MPVVLHLIPSDVWNDLRADEPVTNPSLASEGFIHCTDDPDVMLGVANAFYSSLPGDFVVLHIDVSRLTSPCIWEAPAHMAGGGPALAELFPHVYGTIDRAAVIAVQGVERDVAGAFVGWAAPAQPLS